MELPKTPVFAVGVNVKFSTTSPIQSISDTVHTDWDDSLSDNDFTIADRTVTRSLKWDDSLINVAISESQSLEQSLQLNFDHKDDDSDKQVRWLELPINDISNQVRRILHDTVGIATEDLEHEAPE
ncbi:MAG: hypothetical protein RIC11_19340 [Botrimarina sp.]